VNGNNYSCSYARYTEMECSASRDLAPVLFEATDLPEPIGTPNWWKYVGLSALLVVISGILRTIYSY
jgi:hypothetical protein